MSTAQATKKKVKMKLSLIHIGLLMEEILEGTYQSHFTAKEFKENEEIMLCKPFEVSCHVYYILTL